MSNRFAEPMARLIDELRKLPGVGTKSAQRFAFHLLRSSDADADALAHAILTLKQHLRLCSLCNNITDVDPCTYCTSPLRNHRQICVVEEPTNITGIEKTRSYNGLYHVLHGTLSPIGGVGPDQLRLRNLWPRLAGGEDANGGGGTAKQRLGNSTVQPLSAEESSAETSHSEETNFEELIIQDSGSEDSNSEKSSLQGSGLPDSGLPDSGLPDSGLQNSNSGGSVVEELILAISPTVEGEATARYVADQARRQHPSLRITRIATGVPAGSDIEYADEVTMTRALEGRREL